MSIKNLSKLQITLVSILGLLALAGIGFGTHHAYVSRQADDCFNAEVQAQTIAKFKEFIEWKASKEEHLYYGGKKKTTMSEPTFKNILPINYEKPINKYSCFAQVTVKVEESTKYSGESENIERYSQNFIYNYFSFRNPKGENLVVTAKPATDQ